MRSFVLAAPAAAALLWLAGCAYVGEPLPPALHVPKPVTALTVEQVGPRLEVRFRPPAETTELLPVELGQIELKAGAVEPGAWPGDARSIPVAPDAVSAATPAGPFAGRRILVAARAQSRQGKWSEWSALVPVDVVEPVAEPAQAAAESAPLGARLRWKIAPPRPGLAMRIEKRGPSGRYDEAGIVEDAAAGEWIDTTARFGEPQIYRLTAIASPTARSEAIVLDPFTPEDRFAPSVPTGLAAVPGLGTIEISWDRPTAPDLAGFRLYRETVAGPPGFVRVGGNDLIVAASASDRQIMPGASYRYAVASVDQRGNESARSPAVEATAPN